MSFQFTFIAKNKAAAIDHLDTLLREHRIADVPDEIRSYIAQGLASMRHEGHVMVSATGHLCTDDPNSSEITSAHIAIRPLEDDHAGSPSRVPPSRE